MKTIYKILISLTIGSLSSFAFFSLFGVIAVFYSDHHFTRWISILPKAYECEAFILHMYAIEMITAIMITFSSGLIMGLFIKNNSVFFGFIAFVGFYVCTFITILIELGELFFFPGSSVLRNLISIIMWILLFILMTKLGMKIFNKVKILT